MNFIQGLAAFPVKITSLPAYLSFLLEKGRGRERWHRAQSTVHSASFCPSLSNQFGYLHNGLFISLVSQSLKPDCLSLSGYSPVFQEFFSFQDILELNS